LRLELGFLGCARHGHRPTVQLATDGPEHIEIVSGLGVDQDHVPVDSGV
jgi:hypothetical protein